MTWTIGGANHVEARITRATPSTTQPEASPKATSGTAGNATAAAATMSPRTHQIEMASGSRRLAAVNASPAAIPAKTNKPK